MMFEQSNCFGDHIKAGDFLPALVIGDFTEQYWPGRGADHPTPI
jgi:hypothetical protein